MDCAIATATVKFRMDVNFGDPVTPRPELVTLPALRAGLEPVCVLGYPVETVLAEKIATAIALGPAKSTCVHIFVLHYSDYFVSYGLVLVIYRSRLFAFMSNELFYCWRRG